MEPDAHPWDSTPGTYSPITRLAEHIVIWHPDDFFTVEGHHTRSARDMRDHLMRYKRRCFSDVYEAAFSIFFSKIKMTIRENIIYATVYF